ncbi:MAG: hypothetical protein H6Q33_321 [Deltaproteobacteria bacterium]|nr:hypothetical protein [Deltaproteobacteria bacterium]
MTDAGLMGLINSSGETLRRGSVRLLVSCEVVVPLLVAIVCTSASATAQFEPRWSPPRPIPGYAVDIKPPYLVADQNRTIHAFSSQRVEASLFVFYNQWTLARGWTPPVKILSSPQKDKATVLGAFLDPDGMIHLIFFGGHEQEAQIYYARARVANADKARAWTRPRMIGGFAGKLSSGSLTGDRKGNLLVLYSGYRDGNGLYEVHSTDRGDSWSEPKPAFLTGSMDLWVYGIQATLDDAGRLHVVWDVPNRAGRAEAAYYARLEADYEHWSVPVVLATIAECLYKANWASILPLNKELLAMYNCGAPPHRSMRRSPDRGTTWTSPVVAFRHLIGENGAPVFLVDNRAGAHVVFSNRSSDSTSHGVYHSEWNGDRWSDPVPIVAGPPGPHFNPGEATGVVSQGNLLFVTWAQDPGLSGNPVSYSYATLSVPELPVVAVEGNRPVVKLLAAVAVLLILSVSLLVQRFRRPA